MKHRTGHVLGKVLIVFLVGMALSGCVVRKYTLDKPRVDTTVEGNRGYLAGSPSDAGVSEELRQRRERLGDTRKIEVLEIEMPASGKKPAPQPMRKPEAEPAIGVEPSSKEDVLFKEPQEPEKELSTPVPETTNYTVQKGDTLQKISQKFYRTTRRWPDLYKANRDVLKSPNSIRPGQVLKIPAEEK
jgi:nucleoid-associated protein YgaU